MKSRDEAETLAEKLRAKLGAGWKVRLHENLGWHYNAVSPCGRIKVVESRYSGRCYGYTAYLGEAAEDWCIGYWAEHGDTPQAAIRNVISKAVAERDEITRRLVGLE